MTPWQLLVIAREALIMQRDSYNTALAVAWNGEALARRKTLPSLKSILSVAQKRLAKASPADGMQRLRSFLTARVKPKESP